MNYPEKHTTQVADVSLGLIAVVKWRRCTGFVVLQNSDRSVAVHFYLSDKVMHDAASFGTSCHFAFGSYKEFCCEMKGYVDKFMEETRPDSTEIRELMHAYRNSFHVRYGM